MSLSAKLYKSRHYGNLMGEHYTVHYKGAVVDLVLMLEYAARTRGMVVSRWETSSRHSAWVKTITWAIHTGERPARSDSLPDGSIVVKLSQVEGSTEKCIAYKKLSAMLERLVS